MLGYISKKGKPDLIKDWHVSRVTVPGEGVIYHLASYKGPQVLKPKPEDLIPTNDPSVYAFKITDELDPEAHRAKHPILYGSQSNALELADGKRWVLPKLRICPTMDHELESRYFRDAKGERWEVIAKHKQVYECGDAIFESLTKGQMPEDFNPLDALTKLLQVNYDITEYEVGAFGLYSGSNFWNVVGPYVIDLKAWADYVTEPEEAKKND